MDYVRGSTSPPQSMGLKLTVMAGRNQIQKQLGNFGALYTVTGSNMQEMYFELQEAFSSWSTNPQDNITQLVISTSGPVVFKGVLMDDTEITLTVRKLMVLDNEFKSFSITKTGTEAVRGVMNYVSKTAEQP